MHYSQDAHPTQLLVQSGGYVIQRPFKMRMPKHRMKI